ncbi:MAG: hypothetical protein WCX88_01905 [Patescibacteria group bacterium]
MQKENRSVKTKSKTSIFLLVTLIGSALVFALTFFVWILAIV